MEVLQEDFATLQTESLQVFTETHNIFKTADGAESREDGQPAEKLDLNELVSMNMWGLTPAFMDTLYDGFVEFLQNVKAGDIKQSIFFRL